jgi:hypothetical protein
MDRQNEATARPDINARGWTETHWVSPSGRIVGQFLYAGGEGAALGYDHDGTRDGFRNVAYVLECIASNGPLVAERNALRAEVAALREALKAFLRAPSIGSSGPGSVTIEVASFNLKAAREALAARAGEDGR